MIDATQEQRKRAIDNLSNIQLIIKQEEEKINRLYPLNWKSSQHVWIEHYKNKTDNQILEAFIAGEVFYDKINEIAGQKLPKPYVSILQKGLVPKEYLENILIKDFRLDLDKGHHFNSGAYKAMVIGYSNKISKEAENKLVDAVIESSQRELENTRFYSNFGNTGFMGLFEDLMNFQ